MLGRVLQGNYFSKHRSLAMIRTTVIRTGQSQQVAKLSLRTLPDDCEDALVAVVDISKGMAG